MWAVTTPPSSPAQNGRRSDDIRTTSGRTFVVMSMVFLLVLLVVLLVVSPRLQDQLGMGGSRGFSAPENPVEVTLELGGEVVGVAVWDAGGVCAEVEDGTGTTYRTCAEPDPLKPIWAIDAPDDADPGYLLVATPPDVVNIEGRTTAGETFGMLTQARELPAAWAIVPLPDGAVVDTMTAFGVTNSDLGNAECGVDTGATGGAERLGGGCVVPQQD